MSAYRNQVDALKKAISDDEIEISTIDQYQGRDKDVIFLSLVHTQTDIDDKVFTPQLPLPNF